MTGLRFLEREAPRTNKHHGYSPVDWERLLERAGEEARRLTSESGSFTLDRFRTKLNIGHETLRRVADRLLADGAVVYLGATRLGYAAAGVVRPHATLIDLARLAEERFDPAHKPQPGRRGSAEDRRVERIGTSQRKDIRGAVSLIAERAGGGSAAAVGGGWFDWEETGGDGGAGEWCLVKRVKEWSDEKHRAKFAAREKKWSPDKNTARPKLASATRLLLDLAATAGLIEPSLRHSATFAVHAAEWQPHVVAWTEELMTRSRRTCPRKIAQGCRTLALYATRRSELDPAQVEWTAVRDAIEHDHKKEAIRYDLFTHARWAYNALRRYGLIDATEWPTHQSRRESLVSCAVVRASAKTGDFSGWRTASGALAGPLTTGTYGLRDWARWSRARSDRELKAADLPPREWPRPTAEEERRILKARKADKELFRLSPSVLRNRLHNVALVAGWAERDRKIDWTQHGLERLVDPDLVVAFATDRAHRALSIDEDGDFTSSLGSQVCFTLATIASPYLEARALRKGDCTLADQLRQYSNDLKALGIKYAAEDRKHISSIVAAWDAGTGRGGWSRLKDLRELLVKEIERKAGMSLDEQILAIAGKKFVPSMTWAVLVRDACVISFLRTIPVRERALVEMKIAMWRNEGSATGRGSLRPWEEGIRIWFPKRLTKGKRPYSPYLFRPRHVGDPVREADFRRALWQLYFMAGGAREEVLARVEHREGGEGCEPVAIRTVCDSPYVFPALARRGGGHGTRNQDRIDRGLRWAAGSASAQFSGRVMANAADLGMHAPTLDSLWGATSIHVIRLLYGTHWANQPGMLKAASVMLHHAHTTITEMRYCVPDEGKVDLFDDEEDSIEARLRAEIARLKAELHALGVDPAESRGDRAA